MDIISWGAWNWFSLLVATIIAAFWFLKLSVNQRKEISKSISPNHLSQLLPTYDPKRLRRQWVWINLALVFGALALLRPRWGAEIEETKWKGMDVMLVMDISSSMHTEDAPPSRFQQARKAARMLCDQLRGDRIGLIAFAGEAQMVSPLTMDSDFIKESIDALDSKWILAQGSDLGGALKMARESMERGAEASSPADQSSKSGKLVLLLTDGEDLEQRAEAEAERFQEAGIALGVVGVGTEAGAPVPIRSEQGVLVGYKKDDQGKPVVSRLNSTILKSLAEKAKGRWWLYSGSDRDLREVLNFVSGLQRGEQGSKTSERPIERYRWPLGIAVIFLLIAFLSGWSRVAMNFIVFLVFFQSSSFASSPGVYLDNRAGVEAFQKGDFDAAKKHFGSARAQDPKNSTLTYNEAVAQGALGQTDQAERILKELHPSGQVEYNLGTVYEKKQMTDLAIQHWAKAAQLFEQQGNTQLADLARQKILALKPPPPKPQSPEPSPSPSPQPSQNPQDKGEQKFKSKNLNADDAKKVMNELADREKDLKKKLERKQGRPKESRGKDW